METGATAFSSSGSNFILTIKSFSLTTVLVLKSGFYSMLSILIGSYSLARIELNIWSIAALAFAGFFEGSLIIIPKVFVVVSGAYFLIFSLN